MKVIRVQYTTQLSYVEQNKANIRAVMDDLRNNPIEGFSYATFYLGDGRFMHLSISKDEETSGRLNQRDTFQSFRSQLKESSPLVPPESENPELVGSNFDFIAT